jgi:L-aspartate oxidase
MYDLLIIGSGASGLGLALSLADRYHIALISKADLLAGSSARAQGGIAAVMGAHDSIEDHINDTLIAGAGLCDRAVVEFVVRNAKHAIEWLIERGVQFSLTGKKEFHLTKEGGHSHRRILHSADKTGSAVVNTLGEQVIAHPNIDVFIDHTAIDLIGSNQTCQGAFILNNSTNTIKAFHARITVLATGGASKAYLHTSNPDQTTGDGIAMAHRVGCRTNHLEFNQFHPTTLYHPRANSFLISEAVRGEGGRLVLADGYPFMRDYDSRAELAPRDIVARAIDSEMKKSKIDCVYLDISHLPTRQIKSHFPTIFEKCLSLGMDISKQPIPVVPAAHYTCGGVVTDLNGQTNVAHLYAIGEVACTGLHGANRMASNSLLECLVFAMSAAKSIHNNLLNKTFTITENNDTSLNQQPCINPSIEAALQNEILAIKNLLWNHVGIVRHTKSLQLAKITAQDKLAAIEKLTSQHTPTPTSIEARNIATVAVLMIEAAIARKQNCGLHFIQEIQE